MCGFCTRPPDGILALQALAGVVLAPSRAWDVERTVGVSSEAVSSTGGKLYKCCAALPGEGDLPWPTSIGRSIAPTPVGKRLELSWSPCFRLWITFQVTWIHNFLPKLPCSHFVVNVVGFSRV